MIISIALHIQFSLSLDFAGQALAPRMKTWRYEPYPHENPATGNSGCTLETMVPPLIPRRWCGRTAQA